MMSEAGYSKMLPPLLGSIMHSCHERQQIAVGWVAHCYQPCTLQSSHRNLFACHPHAYLPAYARSTIIAVVGCVACNLLTQIHTHRQNRAHHGFVYAIAFSHAHPQAGSCSSTDTDLAGSEDGLQDGVVLLGLQLLLLGQVALKRAQLLAQHGPIVCSCLRSVGWLLLRHHRWPHQRQHCHVLALPLCIQPTTSQQRLRTEHIGSSNLHSQSRRQRW